MKRMNIRQGLAGLAAIAAPLAIGTTMNSCTFEQEDLFDESAALRIETSTKQTQDKLVAAPNGWVMQYFTGMDDIEGFNIYARFSDNQKVTLASDHRYLRNGNAGKFTECSSIYEMLREDGPVLAFNTWNDVLTPFVDPVDPASAPNTLNNDGEGMMGDHNFVVLSATDEEVKLRGERHGAQVRMIACPTTWEEYNDATNKLKNLISSKNVPNHMVVGGDDTLYFKNLYTGVITYCERIEDPLFPSTINCVFTPNGFRLHHSNTIKNILFQEFKMSADSTCLVSENDSVRVYALWQPFFYGMLTKNVNDGMLVFDRSTLSPAQQQYYDAIEQFILSMNKNNSLKGIGIGKTTSGGNVSGLTVVYYTNKAQTSNRICTLGMNINIGDDYSVTLGFDGDAAPTNSNMSALMRQSTDFSQAITSLASSLVGTYTAEPNNFFAPTAALFNGSGQSFRMNIVE